MQCSPLVSTCLRLSTSSRITHACSDLSRRSGARVESAPDAELQPDDIILRVTATAIRDSDLHLYPGKIPGPEGGDILGHELMGLVEDAGPAVTSDKRGGRGGHSVCHRMWRMPFLRAGTVRRMRKEQPRPRCDRAGTQAHQRPAALFGYTKQYGGIDGGQSESVRAPKADVGPLKVPGSLSDGRVLFLSDILPTGYQAAKNARIAKGSSVAIFGAGPVAMMVAACARLLGAETIFMIDRLDYRLQFAAQT